ncbi:hypothetical protein [Enterobacter sp. Lyrl_3]|uniref:hypothetical protein n=1 Tax=Enterobacter sp. Lyrl_3 TaxID=3110922 RepID=UPI003F7E842E
MKSYERQGVILPLMVAGINELIRKEKIDLNGKSVDANAPEELKGGYIHTTLYGCPSLINWRDIGYDKLRISVWWDYRPENLPQRARSWLERQKPCTSTPLVKSHNLPDLLGAYGSCWLERKEGKYIIGKLGEQFFNIYLRKNTYYPLDHAPMEEPLGYKLSGIPSS